MSDESEGNAGQAQVGKYRLRLYVAGTSAQSSRAISNIRKICEDHLRDKYELEVIDIYQDLVATEADQIVAVPTLVKHGPLPVKKLVGDLSDIRRVLKGLDIRREGKEGTIDRV